MFLASVDNWPHALSYRMVLSVDTFNTRKGFKFLNLSINKPIVVFVANFPKVGALFLFAPTAHTFDGGHFFGRQRFVTKSVHPIVDHAVLVIGRNPHVALNYRILD